MNEQKIKSLVEILKTTIRELEDEVKSNPSSYVSKNDVISDLNYDYSELLTYYNTQDDDGDYD